LSSFLEKVGVVLRRRPDLSDRPKSVALSDDEAPLRGELFSVGQLELHARKLASFHDVGGPRAAERDTLLPRLDENERALRDAYALVTEAVHRGRRITPAAEWFVDNYQLIEEQIRTARRHLPRGFNRELPRLGKASASGIPRVYDLVLELVSHSHGRLDMEGLRAFVASYQTVQTLQLGELWAIPIMLRLALLENLSRVAARVSAGRHDREAAAAWVERMVDTAASAPARVVLVLAEMVESDPPLTLAFAAELASRLQGLGPSLVFPMAWLEQRLAEQGQTVEHVFQLVSQNQAADQVSIGNSIGSLRLLSATDWREFVEAMSAVERLLVQDPAAAYKHMDFATRDRYRHVVEATAKRSSLSESQVAEAALTLAQAADGRKRHVGHFLIEAGLVLLEHQVRMRRPLGLRVRRFVHRFGFAVYAGTVGGGSLLLGAWLASQLAAQGFTGWALGCAGALLALVASQLVLDIVHWLMTLLTAPSLLPRLDFSAGIPEAHHTAVAVVAMLTDVREIDELLEGLEVRYLANREPHLSFVLLTDFRDASEERLSSDDALLAHARAGIEALNEAHVAAGQPAIFQLFHRPRRFNAAEGTWMGWERKRGKLEQFNEALRGAREPFAITPEDAPDLRDVKYVIVLDSDTQLPRDAARELSATLAHPLNRPRFDPERGRVVEGHGILQPRVAITMASSRRSRFAALFTGDPGIDPYTRAVSDVYQDAFDEGSFVGKGIYDVDAFQLALAGKLPDDRVLSHDLLEGAYARAGLLSDVLLFEDYPAAYSADISRRQRWIRGDWQVSGWLRRSVPAPNRRVKNPTSLLSQWKILDNLRRSLLPIALCAALALGWARPEVLTLVSVLFAAVLFVPALLAASAALLRRPKERSAASHTHEVVFDFALRALRQLFAVACLPFEAVISARAIAQTCLRMFWTHRHLLEWRTASDAQRSASTSLWSTYRFMAAGPALALASLVMLVLFRRAQLLHASPLILAWALAPVVALLLSRPIRPARLSLSTEDVQFLRRVARLTWRFFETFVTPLDNHLPPDNFQEDPPNGVAARTSPTNIGLALTANLAAYDFGYLSTGDVLARSRLTFASMEKLARYRGHFYNWYDTRSLEPLRPIYVSTVDSGNLSGHLLTFAAGLAELAHAPILRPQTFAGLADTIDVIAELCAEDADVRNELRKLRGLLEPVPATLSSARAVLERLLPNTAALAQVAARRPQRELASWASALTAQVEQALAELTLLAPWLALTADVEVHGAAREQTPDSVAQQLGALDDIPTLSALAAFRGDVLPAIASARERATDLHATQLGQLEQAVLLAVGRAETRLAELSSLATRGASLAEADYDFLYDRERHLLAIGYNVSDHRVDASYYDLLASEARLASFLAIAQGKLPQDHWFRLGRSLTSSGAKPALLSWSGSMFEYLMPLLIMPTYPGTILDETCQGVVARQLQYGRERGVAWGVSESGYSKTDAHLNYQYRAFGVPGLGFKRGLAEDLVIAPYASVMALMVAPATSCENLRRLAREGRLGPFGFYEAIDHTPARLPRGKDSILVASYMAHHQGMAFLSLAYTLLDKPMQRRFASVAEFRATDLLLQERVPSARAIYPHPAELSPTTESAHLERNLRVFGTPNTVSPQVQLLSNGNYHVMVSNAGGGYSRWRELAVTRWIEDPSRDAWGSFCYLRDTASGSFWSAAHQPTLAPASNYEAIFSQGRAEFRRRDGDIDTHMEISVSPEDDVEIRRVSLTNLGRTPRTIELTSFAEVVLATPAADVAHPAFSNLFVQTEILGDQRAVLCTRRARSGSDKPETMMHLMTVQGPLAAESSYETSRAEFIGRGRSALDPQAMHRLKLGNHEGSVLDPVAAIRNTLVIAPDETRRVHFATGVAQSRDGALALIEKYGDRHSAERVFELSWTHSQVLLRQLDASEADAQLYEQLASHILYSSARLRASRSVIARNRGGQSALWAYAISGDLPIALVRIADRQHIGLVRQLVQAHAYFKLKGLPLDLVIWNEDPSGYRQVLQEEILAVLAALNESELLDKPGGIFLRRADQVSEEDKVLMQTVARLILVDTDGSLAEQLERKPPRELKLAPFVAKGPRSSEAPATPLRARPDLIGWNGLGGFTPDGREYVITTDASTCTPAPWVNVIANPYFGTVVSERGAAYTWCENARNYRLTPWNNDPVSDPSGESFYLRDEHDGRAWSPTSSPRRGNQPYTTRHGFGYSVFEYEGEGIRSELRTFVAIDAPVKFMLFKLKNSSGRARRLSLTGMFELVLGEQRAQNLPYVVSELDPGSGALLAKNPYASEFARRVTFLDCSESLRTHSGDRLEVLGRNGDLSNPACLAAARLSGRVGAALDPCLALQVAIELADGQERELAFTFGSGLDLDDARTLIHRFRGVEQARSALEGVWAYWNRTLSAVHVQTPDTSFNVLANGWLLYQVLSARMWGRSGFYQSGGAFGFRDQLQDAMALVHSEPAILRAQIVRSASRQFREGDVQHWWHPPMGRGVRTRISDDYLWLPYAVCRYVTALGDSGVLDERTSYLEGRAVKPDEDSYYDLPLSSAESGTVYEHCVRAIENGLRFGEHGLPLMGCGDWNDGMNLVGEHGKGESVWLAFFLHDVLLRFVAIAKLKQDEMFAARCVVIASKLRDDIEAHGWDGAWYRRAYFDSGEPLGSASNVDCQIDSLPQSWATLTGAGDPARAAQALASLDRRLVKRELGLIQLFDPPFDKSEANPGYVKGYVPGVRENGGQYTHAAVWSVMAFAAAGDIARAWELFGLINPVHHGDSAESIARYKVEPYVVAADVYTNPQHPGRGGWTWYTGSAAWMYRLAVESLLGLRLEVDQLHVNPLLPAGWGSFDVHYRFHGTTYAIHVHGPMAGGRGVTRVVVDGEDQASRSVTLRDDGREHHAEIWLAGAS
jgi:cellobiose phosphorylase